MFQIPSSSKQFSQPNNSDVNGNIFATKNINFDEEGYIKQTHGFVKISSADGDFQEIDSMFRSDSFPYFLSDDVFRGDLGVNKTLTNATTAESAPTPGTEDDGTYFNDTEVISDGTSVYWNNSGTWTVISSTGLPSNGGTCLAVFSEQASLLIGKGNEVAIVDTSWAVGTSLVLPPDYEVTSIACVGATAYIATRHIGNGDAKLFLWDGGGADASASYSVGTFELSTIKEYDGTVAGVDSLGRFIRFNGGGFDMISAFPVYYSNTDWGDAQNNYSIISNRGMYVDGDVVYFNVNPRTEDPNHRYLYNMPGGVWCFDPKVGLYHRASQSKNTISSDTVDTSTEVNTTTDQLTVASAPNTGTPVWYDATTGSITGLRDETWYYVIKIDSTHIQLARTYQDALAGTEIDLTAISAGNVVLYFVVTNDWGDSYSDNRVAVMTLNNTLHDSSIDRLVYSNLTQSRTDADDYGITVMASAIEARSWLITPKIFSDNISDVFNSITLRYRPLQRGDEIRVKYRKTERPRLPVGFDVTVSASQRITWTSTTTFTTTLDYTDVRAGDEVEIVGGQGAGFISHISISPVFNAGTWTVTLKDACDVVTNGDYARAVINNWTELGTADYREPENRKTFTLDKSGDWIQFKIELRGRDVAISEIRIDNKSKRGPK